MTYPSIILVIIFATSLQRVTSVAVVRLTQQTPCLPAQSCRLQCSVVSGTNEYGLEFQADSRGVVVCGSGRDSCVPAFSSIYGHTQVDYTTSYVDIKSFVASRDAVTWSCRDGFNGTPSNLQVVQNIPPSGPLTWGSTCVSGHAISPASLSCSVGSSGVPPATLTILDSSNTIAGSNQTGSVTGTVTRGGQASCSVTWSAFPSYQLSISPVLCDVQVVASATISIRDITGGDKVITCQAQGYPDTYTFQPWLQSWGGQEVRRVNGSQQGGQYNLNLTSYQDSGTYTCTVDNGVRDSSGQVLRRSASVNVTVQDAPVLPLPSDPLKFVGEDGEPVRLYRTLYAVPDLTSYTWFFNSTDVASLIPGARTNRSRDMVSLPVHGTTVTTEGTVVNLYFQASQKYNGLYRLQVCNTLGCNSASVSLVAASAPFPPESLTAAATTDSIVLFWMPGFAGGDFFQWFHVQYRRQDSQDGQWLDVSTADNRSSSDRTPVTVTVQGLQPDTSYVFRVRAQSSRPQRNLSNYTEITVKTGSVSAKEALYTGSILAAAVVVILVLTAAATTAVICIVLRLRQNTRNERQKASASYQNTAFSRQDVSEYVNQPTDRTHPGADNSQHSGPDSAYSVLDPVSRNTPRDTTLYQDLAQPRLLGNQGNANSAEGQYTSAYELTQ